MILSYKALVIFVVVGFDVDVELFVGAPDSGTKGLECRLRLG